MFYDDQRISASSQPLDTENLTSLKSESLGNAVPKVGETTFLASEEADSKSQQRAKEGIVSPTRPWWDVLFGDSELSVEKSESGWRGKVRTSGLVLLAMFVLAAAAWLSR
jgi:hypothetical protein